MYISRLTFHTIPGRTGEAESALRKLQEMVARAGGPKPRILHTHFASLGAPDMFLNRRSKIWPALKRNYASSSMIRLFRAGPKRCRPCSGNRPSANST